MSRAQMSKRQVPNKSIEELKPIVILNNLELARVSSHLEQYSKDIVNDNPELSVSLLEEVVRLKGVQEFLSGLIEGGNQM